MNQHSRNFYAFLWHATFLALTLTLTDVNTILPALIVKAGGTAMHIGLLTAIMVGTPIVGQAPVRELPAPEGAQEGVPAPGNQPADLGSHPGRRGAGEGGDDVGRGCDCLRTPADVHLRSRRDVCGGLVH